MSKATPVEISQHPTLADKRVLAVISPANWNRMVEVEDLLRRVFPRAELAAPASLEAMEGTLRASHGNAELVIAMGGDGTLHRALQWIDLETQTLGLLPGGTGNDLARTLGYPEDLHGRVAHLAALSEQRIDLGLLHLGGAGVSPANIIRFHTCAGIGLDAATLSVRGMNELLRRNYKLAFLFVLFRLQNLVARLKAGAHEFNGDYCWILAMNSREIGGGVQIAPDARLDDGLLDLVLVNTVPKLELIKLMPLASNGQHVHHSAVTYLQAPEISCELAQAVSQAAVDGELYECNASELRFSLEPLALRLLR